MNSSFDIYLGDDPFVPRCQTALLQESLRQALPERSVRWHYASRLALADQETLPWVGARLECKRLALESAHALYLDARLFVRPSVGPLLRAPGAPLSADAERLGEVRLLLVRGAAPARVLAPGPYSVLSASRLPDCAPPPPGLEPTSHRTNPEAPVSDTCRAPERPWRSPLAPAAAAWTRALREALAAGVVALGDVEADLEEGLVRPSLLWQLETGLDDPRSLPRDWIEADFEASYAELSPSQAQRALLSSKSFRRRMLALRLLNKARAQGWRAFARASGRRALARARKAARRAASRALGRRRFA